MNEKEYFELNKTLWNQRAEIHVDTEFYDMAGFRKGNTSLKKIELDLLGDVSGKSLLHLQCHFGQDTLSLSRMGAEVTGLDFSDIAIDTAKKISNELDLPAEFICANVLDAENKINKQFDIIYTSYGAICWLPDLKPWGKSIRNLLKPGGMVLIVEFHPALMMFSDDFSKVEYGYFNNGALLDEFEGTYADKDSKIPQKSAWWNHSIADVFSALLENELKISHFSEYNYSPYNLFDNTQNTEHGFQAKEIKNKLPYVFALQAIK